MSTLVLSTTAFKDACQCPKRYYYHQVRHLEPHPSRTTAPVRKGIWLHKLLMDYYLEKDLNDSISGLVEWAEEHGVPQESIDSVYDEVVELVDQYMEYYSKNMDLVKGKIILAETPLTVRIPRWDATMRATLDLVTKTKRGIWVVEHKSTSDIPDPDWRAVDPQTAMQAIIAMRTKDVPKPITPDGILFNYLWTKMPTIPGVTQGNKKEPPRFYANAGITTTKMFDKGRDNCVPAIAKWQTEQRGGEDYGEIAAYIDEARKALVSDSLWFQQYEVQRPMNVLVQTMKDIDGVLATIRKCEETGHWWRNFHVFTCPKFCFYSDLCVAEYVNGRESEIVPDRFVVDTDQSWREGK
jgi:hypothetical protein